MFSASNELNFWRKKKSEKFTKIFFKKLFLCADFRSSDFRFLAFVSGFDAKRCGELVDCMRLARWVVFLPFRFTFLAQFTLWPAAFYPWLSPVPHWIVFKFENLNLMKDLCGLSDGPFVIDFGGSHDPLNPLNERPLLMRLASCILASLIIQGRGELLLVPLAALSFPAN